MRFIASKASKSRQRATNWTNAKGWWWQKDKYKPTKSVTDDDDGDDQSNPDITIQNATQAYYDPSDEPVAESPFKFEVGHRHL